MMKTYAQNFEDVMLVRLFRGRSEGFYIDVGAGDPTRFSVTRWLYDQGWSGINVEPNAAFFRALTAQRPRDVTLDCGAGAENGWATYSENTIGELSSFGSTRPGATTRKVRIRTLDDILAEHRRGRSIDFLKIDAEGYEAEVLKGIDLRRHRPVALIVEAVEPGGAKATHGAWEHSITDRGYVFAHFDALNRFYLAEEHAALKSVFALPPNITDEIVIHPASGWPVVKSGFGRRLEARGRRIAASVKSIFVRRRNI